ncbi:HNH endonuclease [Vagococcus entomophilus]|uniref:Putative HNH nuclease YajD n=1 Tax=Vagococcus entomophilus TaxID=1160095 RepID=A0A430AKA9_9ENTE|nr:HNH endonuclease [Vagococcus entomophilus]RSU08443.1 HNH endonuclease [Vagococcus entomophilus]
MLNVETKEDRAAFYNSSEWKVLRQKILERDNYECQWCKAEGKVNTNAHSILEVDHIKELEYHPELALEESNMRTLCKECHNKRHKRFNYRSSKKRSKWADDERW